MPDTIPQGSMRLILTQSSEEMPWGGLWQQAPRGKATHKAKTPSKEDAELHVEWPLPQSHTAASGYLTPPQEGMPGPGPPTADSEQREARRASAALSWPLPWRRDGGEGGGEAEFPPTPC